MDLSTGLLIYLVLLGVTAFCAYAAMSDRPPTTGPLGDLYPLQPYLYPAKFVLIAVFVAGVLTRAGVRGGLISQELYLQIEPIGRMALVAALLCFLGLIASAALKEWRSHR